MTAPTPPEPTEPTEPTQPAAPPEPAPDPSLGDPGRKALAEERAARKAAEKQRAELEARLREFEDRDKTEAEKLAAKAEQAEKRATAATARAVKAEVRALADGFADREDAILNLGDLSQYITGDDVDTEAITAKLTEVLERKPHLAKAPTGPRTPAPDPSQGARGAAGQVGLDAQIAEAKAKGDILGAIALERSKLLTIPRPK